MNNDDYRKPSDRDFGWGMISGAAGSMIAWAIVSALGIEPSVGLLFGSMGVGVWKVYRNGR